MDKLSSVFKCSCMTKEITTVANAMFMAEQIALIEESANQLPRKGFGTSAKTNFHIYKDAGSPKNNSNLICHVKIKTDIVTISECNTSSNVTGSTQYYNKLIQELGQIQIFGYSHNGGTVFEYNLNIHKDKQDLIKTIQIIKNM